MSIIIYFFPKETKFKYEYQKGLPWRHDDLIAPFDCAIQKFPEEIEKEKKQIVDASKLYFKCNSGVVQDILREYDKKFDVEWLAETERLKQSNSREYERLLSSKFKEKTKRFGKDLLNEVYQGGVIILVKEIENKNKDYAIVVVKEGLSKDHDLGDLYTLGEASKYIRKRIDEEEFIRKDLLIRIIDAVLQQNVEIDYDKTQKALKEQIVGISETIGMVQKGERVISHGDIVDGRSYKVLESLKKDYEKKKGAGVQYKYILIGQFILVGIVFTILIFFLRLFRRDIIDNNVTLSFILIQLVLIVIAAEATLKNETINVYIIPYCVLPIMIKTFFDSRIAIFVHITAVLMVGFIVPNPYEFIFLQTVTGIVAVFTLVNLKNRSQLFITAAILFVTYLLAHFGIEIVKEGTLEGVSWEYASWFALSSSLTIFSYPLIYAFEKVFGLVSDVTLMELSDTNNKLLRKLNFEAPGTFQHSLQVANLCEDAIRMIGGNTLLVRTAALYHDIGKTKQPIYFMENQLGGINPHDELPYQESAKIIINHVIDGIELAKKYNIPEVIIDFIRTHHGTTTTAYFLKKYKKEHPDEEIDEHVFKYPGPLPFSKETAVLMMADSVEAASRSLKSYDAESIENLVDGIIDGQVREGQFENANITFKDVKRIKRLFKKKLANIYHVRIEYPK